jgi:hypothetical protein
MNFIESMTLPILAMIVLSCQTDSIPASQETGSIHLDTLGLAPFYYADCHLARVESEIPTIYGIPKSEIWNARWRMFEEEAVAFQCEGQDYTEFEKDPHHDVSDTLNMMDLSFDIMSFNDTALSIHCMALFHGGGTMWWSHSRVFNVDLRTGEDLLPASSFAELDPAQYDAYIGDFFQAYGGCSSYYACHSCEDPDFLHRALRTHLFGISDGFWVAVTMMLPGPCANMAKQFVYIPVAPVE